VIPWKIRMLRRLWPALVVLSCFPGGGVGQDAGTAETFGSLHRLDDTASLERQLLIPLLSEERVLVQDFGPEHPRMIDLRSRIELARQYIARQARIIADRKRAAASLPLYEQRDPSPPPAQAPKPNLPRIVDAPDEPRELAAVPEVAVGPVNASLEMPSSTGVEAPIAGQVAVVAQPFAVVSVDSSADLPPAPPLDVVCEAGPVAERAAASRRATLDFSQLLCAIRPVENATPLHLAVVLLLVNFSIVIVALAVRRIGWSRATWRQPAAAAEAESPSTKVACPVPAAQQRNVDQSTSAHDLRESIGKMLLDPSFLAESWYHIPVMNPARRR